MSQANPFGVMTAAVILGVSLAMDCFLGRQMSRGVFVLRVPYWKRNEGRSFWFMFYAILHENHRYLRAVALEPLKHDSRTQKWTLAICCFCFNLLVVNLFL